LADLHPASLAAREHGLSGARERGQVAERTAC
jgi:hypothetical protein